jgi:molybdate transport system ATP-binding protein
LKIPVLYVSHSPDEVARLADQLVLLETGRVRAKGPAVELFARLDLPLALEDEASSVILGRVAAHDEPYGLTRVEIPGGSLSLARMDRAIGAAVRVRIHARDVSLALDEPGTSSILNILPAEIIGIREVSPSQVLVKLRTTRAGRSALLARITRRSRDLLDLRPGKPVFAQVKAVALMD